MFVTLAPWDERTRSQQEITAELNRSCRRIPGVQVFARTANSLGIRGGGQGLQFAITGTDYDALADAADELIAAMEKDPAFDRVRLNYDTTQPQLSIKIDRERAADLGISVDSISAVVQTLLDGTRPRQLLHRRRSDRDSRAGARRHDPGRRRGLDSIQLRTASGKMVPLSSLVTFEESAVAPSLPRQDQRRAVPMTRDARPTASTSARR